MASKGTVLTVAAVLATGVLAYAVYFDYKRRNDNEFRRQLKKDKKRVAKSVRQPAQEPSTAVNADVLREALRAIKTEPPVPLEERENYFMNQVGMGEQLAQQGPPFHVPAAIAFFRALRIYPAPAELIGIYQKTVLPAVFNLVIELTNMDVTEKVEGYYDRFPPKSMNVSIVPQPSKSMAGARLAVVVNQDVAAGETIYKELPIVAALDQDLQAAGTHCTHCFRVIQSGMSIQSEDEYKPIPAAYCSKSCLLTSKKQSQSLLFTMDSPLPPALIAGPVSEGMNEKRKAAQAAFIEARQADHRNVPMLTARFIARQVANETNRLVISSSAAPPPPPSAGEREDYTDVEPAGEYTLADHTERFRYIDVTPPETDLPLLSALLEATLPGIEEFTTGERHAAMTGKMLYNVYGVCFAGGRDDRPAPTTRPEDVEKTRTPYGTDRQVGSALYTLSSYLTHSCDPSARVSFTSGTTELHVVANRDLKKGDVVSIAFVDVTQRSGESVAEARRRRRVELARGWKFACGCDRCGEENVLVDVVPGEAAATATTPTATGEEAAAKPVEEEDLGILDEARVDVTLRNYQENLPRAHDPVIEDLPDIVPEDDDDDATSASGSSVPDDSAHTRELIESGVLVEAVQEAEVVAKADETSEADETA